MTLHKARPMLFNGPMVRALLAGTKTQTRRVVKFNVAGRAAYFGKQWHPEDPNIGKACPYGQPGDLLWVRESILTDTRNKPLWPEQQEIIYDATPEWALDWTGKMSRMGICPAATDSKPIPPDETRRLIDAHPYWRKRPGIHMPRWASRLTLRITEVRVQRLQEISEKDAKAEGVDFGSVTDQTTGEIDRDACEAFEALWESINGPGSWDANPWIWCVSFDVIKQNVDDVLRSVA